jgi:NitT/TauT family transport system permease protein
MGPDVLATPQATLRRLGDMLGMRSFWRHAGASGWAFLLSVIIAWGAGLGFGLALGFHRLSAEVSDPILSALYSIPKITLYPVILLIFGLGISAKVAFGTIHGFFPVAIFAMGAVRNVNPVYLKAARSLRMDPVTTAWTILLPAALPEIMTGLRVGFAAAMLGILVGELFAADAGLGFSLMRSINNHDIASVMALTLVIFLVAVIGNSALGFIERRVTRR